MIEGCQPSVLGSCSPAGQLKPESVENDRATVSVMITAAVFSPARHLCPGQGWSTTTTSLLVRVLHSAQTGEAELHFC